MNAAHLLKCWLEPFQALVDGRKTCEFRRDDGRGFEVGDVLDIREWDPDAKHNGDRFSGRALRFSVTHISRGPSWGIPAGFVAMSLGKLP